MSTTCLERARGSALIVAMFLLVVLALLGAFIVSVTSSQAVGSAHDVEGMRAYQAARYGSEWGVYQVLRGDPNPTNPSFLPAVSCATAGTFCALCRAAAYGSPTSSSLSGLTETLAPFTVTVSCEGQSYTEGADTVWVYRITANACNRPSGGACPSTDGATVASTGYIERRVSLTVAN